MWIACVTDALESDTSKIVTAPVTCHSNYHANLAIGIGSEEKQENQEKAPTTLEIAILGIVGTITNVLFLLCEECYD